MIVYGDPSYEMSLPLPLLLMRLRAHVTGLRAAPAAIAAAVSGEATIFIPRRWSSAA